MFCSLAAIGGLLAIYLFIAGESLAIWKDIGIIKLLFCSDWQPAGNPPQYGFFSMIVSTLWSSLGSIFIAAPLGVCCGIFLSEYAPAAISAVIRTVLYILQEFRRWFTVF
ncbi:phosphate transport system permease protein [Sporomusa acidovorans]|nr:hypothetical protein SPACI_22100 [Sporomusa acidovorans DSM 3132]SDF79659.1 phosphate transport system permease protein [Sporomusa acidovorans]